MKFKIFQKEIQDGVAEQVKAKSSVAYDSVATPYKPSQEEAEQFKILAGQSIANSNTDQLDLYYLNSVLVSTGWNKNDDVFDLEQVWTARNTPEDKQFNFMHNEADIIGHITANMVIDHEGNEIPDDIPFEELPEKFDIVTSAVLYNSWTTPELKQRMDAIIEEIEEGKWFVSMECLFNDFDYAAVSPEGQQVVIAREEASAFLTKHLRAYGGSGEYEGYKLGRVLKNISFSGKGLVSNPANPRSVILESDPFSKTEAKSINEFNIQENSNMADERLVQQIEELKATLAEALAAKADLEAKLANASTEALAGELEEVKAEVESKTQAFTELQEQFNAVSEEKVQLESALAEKEEKLNEALAAIEKAEAEAKLAARKAALVEAGAEEEEIEGILEAFAEATDEMFEQVVALKKKANFPPKKDEEEEEEKEDEEALKKKANKKSKSEEAEAEAEDAEEVDEAEASEEVLEQVEEQAEAALVDAGETDEVVSARAVASEWLTENVLRTIQ
tara:strand:- start:7077 stop:8597 length:1521 start_codon:yes stop_codon:yes gene_type:complete